MDHKHLVLPATIVSPADIGRVKRDLDAYNDAQRQAELRAKKTGTGDQARVSRAISELAELNQVDLHDLSQRQRLLERLELAVQEAPVVTLSFAVEPSSQVLGTLIDWLRQNIHPGVLVRVGLQPNIAAGCILRTPSRLYDLSLRRKLDGKRSLLLDAIRGVQQPEKAEA